MNDTDVLRKKTLPVSEIFYSLQGEGPLLGLPSLFLRLGGCIEPYCPWCDTPYALDEMEEMRASDILEKLRSYPCRRLVITGGEPFLQWGNGLSELHRRLSERRYELQYETSGKVRIPFLEDAVIVCSPKYIDRTWHFEEANVSAVHYYKFLAGEADWFGAIEGFITEHGIDRDRVYIMPLGTNRQEQIDGMEAVFSFCMQKGFRMSPRLHTLTYNGRRGV
jgi:7-carboxy-7-deazaguanine synthase